MVSPSGSTITVTSLADVGDQPIARIVRPEMEAGSGSIISLFGVEPRLVGDVWRQAVLGDVLATLSPIDSTIQHANRTTRVLQTGDWSRAMERTYVPTIRILIRPTMRRTHRVPRSVRLGDVTCCRSRRPCANCATGRRPLRK